MDQSNEELQKLAYDLEQAKQENVKLILENMDLKDAIVKLVKKI